MGGIVGHGGAVVVVARQPEVVRRQLVKIRLQADIGVGGALVGQITGGQQQVHRGSLGLHQVDHRLQRAIGIDPQQLAAAAVAQVGIGQLHNPHGTSGVLQFMDSGIGSRHWTGRRREPDQLPPASGSAAQARPFSRQCSSQSARKRFCCDFSSCWCMSSLG